MTKKFILYTVLIILVFLWMIPLYSTIITSLKTLDEIMKTGFWAFPKHASLHNFYEALTEGNMNRYLINSFIITITSVMGVLFMSSLGANALARYNFKGNHLILFTFLGFNMLPPQMLLIPVFRLTNLLRIYDTYLALILFHISFQTGFGVFFLRNFMKTIPSEISDAARTDGASEFGIYWRVILPLTVPSLAALGTLNFTWIWNDYLWAIVLLRNDNLKPVTAGLASLQGLYASSWGMQNAAALIAVVPTIIVFLFLQKYFIKGLTMGALK